MLFLVEKALDFERIEFIGGNMKNENTFHKYSMILKSICLIGLSLMRTPAFAGPQLQLGSSLAPVQLEEALASVKPGSIILLGEEHNTQEQPKFQIEVMQAIRSMNMLVSVGMEFVSYPFQNFVDQYRSGSLIEADFLKNILWSGFKFDFYREQIRFPKLGESQTIALNAPQFLTAKVAKLGLGSLSQDELALLPAHFQTGNASYFERFKNIMQEHLPNAEALNSYFAAQSIWDDTMAWKATDFIKANPNQVLVIVVGEFHTQYGGGLPERIKARGIENLISFSLINTKDMDANELQENLLPSQRYGDRANYIWTNQY